MLILIYCLVASVAYPDLMIPIVMPSPHVNDINISVYPEGQCCTLLYTLQSFIAKTIIL